MGVFLQVTRQSHGTEIRSAHRTVFSVDVMSRTEISLCPFRIERQVELVFPAELVAGFAQCIVANLCSRMAFGEIGGMGGNLVCDDAYTHIFFIRQGKMLFRSDIAKHGRAQPTNLSRSDSGGNMIVSRSNVGDQGPSV